MKYYRTLTMWHEHDAIDFRLIDSHEKAASVRDRSTRLRLRTVLSERLRNSKNMVLIVTEDTRLDADWVPFEIAYAVDTCAIPIIAAYPHYDYIQAPAELSPLWPGALADRIRTNTARVIHVPFKREPLKDAISQFSHDSMPSSSLSYYSHEAYASFGIPTSAVR